MNLANLLLRNARRLPTATALVDHTAPYCDWATLAARAAALAGALTGRCGLAPGDRVGLFMSNHPDYLVIKYAIWWAGLTALPINAKLHARELAWILDNAGARVCFVSADLADAVAAAGGALDPAVTLIVPEPADGYGPSFTITVKSGAPAGLYAIHVADGSRRTASLPLEVVGAKSSDDGGDGTGAKTPGGEAFDRLDLEQRKRVQRALCVNDDGTWGPDTRAALQEHAESDDSTDDNMQEQLALNDREVAARCDAGDETAGQGQSLREALNKASKAVKDQSMDLADPAGYAVTVGESTVTEADDGLALSVTLSIVPPDGVSPAEAVNVPAIKEAILGRIQDTAVQPNHISIANLDELVRDGFVSKD